MEESSEEDVLAQIFKEDMDSYYLYLKEMEDKNKKAIKEVKKLINYSFSNIKEYIEGTTWQDEGFVEAEKTDYKSNSYPNHEFYRIKGEYTNFMRQNGVKKFYALVWQTSAYEDSYNGYILFPLINGKYWKISYSC